MSDSRNAEMPLLPWELLVTLRARGTVPIEPWTPPTHDIDSIDVDDLGPGHLADRIRAGAPR